VLLTVDTLRFDLGYMGYPKPITPNIDALAARSATFEHAYATASYTPKSLGPLLIGRYASETWRDPAHFTTFYPKNVFLAERIQAGGGYSFAAMCHHYFKWDTGYRQGFERWDMSAMVEDSKDNDRSVTSDRLSDVALAMLANHENIARRSDAGAPVEPSRFFAWFHYLDPHPQYVPHDEAPDFGGGSVSRDRALYDGEVWFADKHIGRVLDYIASQPWGADTAIVLTADHGESFGEHGFWKHGRELWESVVRVPLVIHVPGTPPRRVAVKRSHIDIAPTILDLMGIPATTGDGALRGKSMRNDTVADSADPLEERDVYMDMPEGPYNEMRRAIITGPSPGLKLIDFGSERYELYDLAADPDEKRDIVADAEKYRLAMKSLRRVRGLLQEVKATR
jgi:arylsulfatase A-like enzyme